MAGFQVSPEAFDAFLAGRGTLPPNEEGYVLAAMVWLEMRDRRPVEVFRIDWTKRKVLPDGKLDPAYNMDLLRSAMSSLPPLSGSMRPQTNVVRAEHHFEHAKYAHMARWEPIEQEVQAVRSAINERAGRPVPWNLRRS